MRDKRTTHVKFFMLLIAGLVTTSASAQIVQVGFKAGANYSWVHHDDSGFREKYDVKPVPGFNAGLVAAFKMKSRYFLHTELIYSTKGRIVTGDIQLEDRVVYHYIEIPMIYNIHFKGKLGGSREFKWYAGIGPNFSYWLGGKGDITEFSIADEGADPIPYTIKFGERAEAELGLSKYVYVTDARRLQLGINIGGGIMLEPNNVNRIMIDLRMELGHTWLGNTESASYALPPSYNDNLRVRNLGARFSVMYLFETNLDKKIRNKGKSTKKKRRL